MKESTHRAGFADILVNSYLAHRVKTRLGNSKANLERFPTKTSHARARARRPPAKPGDAAAALALMAALQKPTVVENTFPYKPNLGIFTRQPMQVEVLVEIPRGSFVKRGSNGRIDFVSPVPCPFNYGSIPSRLGLEGDLLDAVVLGPRLPRGTRVNVMAWGAVTLMDRGMFDDKLICALREPTIVERRRVLRFFHFYAKSKGILNFLRRQPGRNACMGWCTAEMAMRRSTPRPSSWTGPQIQFSLLKLPAYCHVSSVTLPLFQGAVNGKTGAVVQRR